MALSLTVLSALVGLAIFGGLLLYRSLGDSDPEEQESVAEVAEESLEVSKSYSALLTASVVALFYPVARAIRWVPYLGSKIWKAIAVKSLYHYHRAHGGDRTGFEVTPSNKIRLTPVKWKGPESVGDDEKPGWRAKGRDKVWSPTTLGQTGPRLGKTPVIPLDSDSWKATSILESRVAEAVDLGETRPLYRVDEANLTATISMDEGPKGEPLADGGYGVEDVQFDPRSSPIFEDTIIDLGSDDYDGQAVSWWKAKELMLERTTTDEMHNQEERGFLAGRSRKDMMRWMWKIFLIAGLVAVAGLIGKELVFVLFGAGGGGGGSGIIPLTLLPLLPTGT